MRIMAYNILEGGTGRIDPIAEVIRQENPDVAVIAEAWDPAAFAKLAGRLGMEFFLAENPRNSEGAIGLLTRLPIRQAVNHAPLDERLTRSAFAVTLEVSAGKELTVIGVHLHARETLADEQIRLSELPAVLEIARGFAGRPHLLAGDFNAHHPQQVIDLGKLRPKTRERIKDQNHQIPRQVIERVLEAGYADAHALLHRPENYGTSVMTSQPAMRVDYVFVPAELKAAVRRCDYPHHPLARYASDHFPVVAEVELGE